MTELQHYRPAEVATYSQPVNEPGSVVTLREWAESARAAHAVAESLVQTSFVPEAFRGKAHEATAAILSGAEVGLSPMAALRSYDVISGTAAPRAITLRAIVQSRGHDIWIVESTETRAIVRGQRAGSDKVQESVWDMSRAKGLGLLGKHNWKAQAKAMLIARATAECCRLVAADAILGIPYASEELDDGSQAEQAPRTAQRRTTRAKATVERPSAPEPDLPEAADDPLLPDEDDAPAPAAEPTAGEPEATRPQLDKLHATLGDLDVKTREDKLSTLGMLLGRQIDSAKDLTKADASKVIDLLDRCLQDDDPARALDGVLASIDSAGPS